MSRRDHAGARPALDAPLTYPGVLPEASYLLLPGGRTLDIEERPPSLDEVLLREGAVSMGRRHAVLAVGSNAAPAQLARKLAVPGVSPVVPVVRAQVSALQLLPSAHLNRHGYVPAAPARASADHRCACFVTFLDDVQLQHIDLSEPNYSRVMLDPQHHVVRLGNGEILARCHVYRSRHGVLVDARLASSSGAMPDQRTLLTSLLELLPALQGRGLTADSFVAALRDGVLDSATVTLAMQAHLEVRAAGLAELDAEA